MSVVKGKFWEGNNNNKTATQKNESSKNQISPVELSAGDSFYIPFSLIAEKNTGGANNKLGFFLATKNEDKGNYNYIVDSGWLSKTNYAQQIKNNTVKDKSDAFTVKEEGNGFRVTVNQDGLTLLFNSWQQSGNVDNIFNGVSVTRSK